MADKLAPQQRAPCNHRAWIAQQSMCDGIGRLRGRAVRSRVTGERDGVLRMDRKQVLMGGHKPGEGFERRRIFGLLRSDRKPRRL